MSSQEGGPKLALRTPLIHSPGGRGLWYLVTLEKSPRSAEWGGTCQENGMVGGCGVPATVQEDLPQQGLSLWPQPNLIQPCQACPPGPTHRGPKSSLPPVSANCSFCLTPPNTQAHHHHHLPPHFPPGQEMGIYLLSLRFSGALCGSLSLTLNRYACPFAVTLPCTCHEVWNFVCLFVLVFFQSARWIWRTVPGT